MLICNSVIINYTDYEPVITYY